MPLYRYRCPSCGVFEQRGGLEERETECACGQEAVRLPFSGIPQIKGETVARSIPDPHYQQEAAKRELNRTWGDATRSMELLRKNRVTDSEGNVSIDLKAVDRG
jgi:putative FmdB family regulatory protein